MSAPEECAQHWILQEGGDRLDVALSKRIPDVSRSEVRRWFDEKRILVNDKVARPSLKTQVGMDVTVLRPAPVSPELIPEDIPLDIIYEDDWLLVINKPQGMVVHPAPGHRQGTLVHALLHYLGTQGLSDINQSFRPGIVHRIDKDTSGLLLIMKNNEAHRRMARLIADHEVERSYYALVYGSISESSGSIIAPLGRDPNNRQRMAVVRDGKPATTHFKVLKKYGDCTFVKANLETGRTHQIRVHFQYIGHPVVGDPVYAGKRPHYGLEGQALHAGQLRFIHPMTGAKMRLRAPLPSWFTSLLARL
ncbi:MAG TPA: RluA family pseudouridine synthase [Clostridiaceae bacterium]|nr:RluA family pseudouridine synthase [Clostridiaceae bacterium]